MSEPQTSSVQYDGRVKYQSSPTARFAGYILMALGGFASFTMGISLLSGHVSFLQAFSGLACLVVGYVMVTSYEGITLDTRTRRYRNYTWIAGFRRGEWLHLPEIVRITVAPFNAAYVMNDAIAPSIKVQQHGLYRVLLSIENSRVGIVATIAKQDKALAAAEKLRELFGVEITSTLKVT